MTPIVRRRGAPGAGRSAGSAGSAVVRDGMRFAHGCVRHHRRRYLLLDDEPASADDLDLGADLGTDLGTVRKEFERERTAWGTADTVTVAALGGIASITALFRSIIG